MIDYTLLDPGIRETVRLVHRFGFQTSDSGDGVTKLRNLSRKEIEAAGLLDSPHVVIRTTPQTLVLDARRLRGALESVGVQLLEEGGAYPGVRIEATYGEPEGEATIMLWFLHDTLLEWFQRQHYGRP